MKLRLLGLALLASASSAFAQINGDGYYRVQNFGTERWLYLVDNKSEIYYASTSADVAAILLSSDVNRKYYDPSCIVYVQNVGDNSYDFKAQGESIKDISGGYFLHLSESNTSYGMTYLCSFNYNGYSIFLWDDTFADDEITESHATTGTQNNKGMRQWQAFGVNSSDDSNYFGIKPDIEIDGKYYKAFYAAFPFMVKSSGMAVYYAKELINSNSAVTVVKADDNAVIPTSTPVFIECSSSDYSNNRIDIVDKSGSSISTILKGNYFCYDDEWYPKHKNVLTNNTATMRVLGKMSNGLLGYVTSSDEYIPANSSYLVVPEGSPSELPLSGAITGISSVKADSPLSTSTAVYTMQGVKVADTFSPSSLSPGVYIVGGRKMVVK